MSNFARAFTRFRHSIPHRGKLILHALTAGSRDAITASERVTDGIAESDMWNADYTFDTAAIATLKFYLSDKPMAFINFAGTRWEHRQWHSGEPQWSRDLERRILEPILCDLELDVDEEYEQADLSGLTRQETIDFVAELNERKARARRAFADLAGVLWD